MGVKLLVSDAHEGIKAAASRRLCVHLAALPRSLYAQCPSAMRNALAHACKSGRRVGSAFIATALAHETPEVASQRWGAVADQTRPKLPKLAAVRDDTEPDVQATMTFPNEDRAEFHPTNPLELEQGG